MTALANGPTCPLCDGPAKYGPLLTTTDTTSYDCVRCHRFRISRRVIMDVLSRKPEYKPLLSAFCRRLPEGTEPPIITTETVEQIIRDVPQYTPPEKLDNLLELMGRMTPALGQPTTFNPTTDYPLLVARDPTEVRFLLIELDDRKFVFGPHHSPLSPPTVLSRGWERLEEIKRSGRLSNRVFVAMSFDKSLDSLYSEAIEPAIRIAGWDPLRLDRVEFVNRIDDEIIGQIRRSRFMVADFTGQCPGVYLEAGMMIGLGRTVIWMCDKKELGQVHFDVRQFNFIDYESLPAAQDRLYKRILAIEGEGPGQFEKP